MFALIPFNSKAYVDPCKLPGTVTTFMVGTCQLLLMAHYTLYSCVDILHWAHTMDNRYTPATVKIIEKGPACMQSILVQGLNIYICSCREATCWSFIC